MIVLGDALPHDANLGGEFNTEGQPAVCPNTPPTDPGSQFQLDELNGYPDVGPLTTTTVLDGLKANHTNLSFVTYNVSANQVAGCQAAIARYTGGNEVQHGDADSLKSQIVNLINQAGARIDRITQNVTLESAPEARASSTRAAGSRSTSAARTICSAVTGPATAPTDIALQEHRHRPAERGRSAPTGSTSRSARDGVERAAPGRDHRGHRQRASAA